MTLTDYKQATRKTWARIAAELTEQAMARDPDKMKHIYEGRLYSIVRGTRASSWELQALEDLCGSGSSYN